MKARSSFLKTPDGVSDACARGRPLWVRGLRHFMVFTVFVLAWFAHPRAIQAAASGMCSSLAESIAAPPPFFPTRDTVMTSCDPEKNGSVQSGAPGGTQEHLERHSAGAQQECILSEPDRPPLLKTSERFTPALTQTEAEEHRAEKRRPPRLARVG